MASDNEKENIALFSRSWVSNTFQTNFSEAPTPAMRRFLLRAMNILRSLFGVRKNQ